MNERALVNQDQGLYVMKCGEGYTCIGFDVAYNKAMAVAEWCGVDRPSREHVGTEDGYRDYRRIMHDGAMYAARTGGQCTAEMHPQLTGLEHFRVEVVDADGETDRFWVGKSTGWMPCHLRIHSRRSHGGPAVDARPYRSVRVVRRDRWE